jgi:hypothetical protein
MALNSFLLVDTPFFYTACGDFDGLIVARDAG